MRAVLRAAFSLAQDTWESSVLVLLSLECDLLLLERCASPWIAESPPHQCRVIRGQLSPRYWHQGRESWCVCVQSAGLLVVAVSDMCSCCAECSCRRLSLQLSATRGTFVESWREMTHLRCCSFRWRLLAFQRIYCHMTEDTGGHYRPHRQWLSRRSCSS